MNRPSLQALDTKSGACRGVTLAVYAPFGTDDELSTFPDKTTRGLREHPLVKHLMEVARQGTGVVALIDLVDHDTALLEIPAGEPDKLSVESRWKQDMSSWRTLAGFLGRAHGFDRDAALVLALEGHGAGYLPEIDRRQLSQAVLTDHGRLAWQIMHDWSTTQPGNTAPPLPGTAPLLPGTAPLLPGTAPLLPGTAPLLPANHMPLSTWALGQALRAAARDGVPQPAVVHFDNCFNMSVEVLHTVAPHAGWATGYMNYNFFTAGEGYPEVFRRLRQQGGATAGELAGWFADENRRGLAAKGNHPTVGGVVELARLHGIAAGIDGLSDALLAALGSPPAERAAVISRIQEAIARAQQYDSVASMALDVPDEMTDIGSLSVALQQTFAAGDAVHGAAQALQAALKDIWHYGDADRPWPDPTVVWDFSDRNLAMNIFLPDPMRRGIWDWRSPYYLVVNPDEDRRRIQPHLIDFVTETNWVEFLNEYHKDVPFLGLLPAEIPRFPTFNRSFEAPPDDKCPPKKRRPRC